MKKINQKNLFVFTLLIIGFYILLINNSYSAKSFFETESNFDYFEDLFNNKQKYILFLIVFFPSIFFFKQKKWILFSISVLLQLFFVLYWDSISNWIQNLAGDSISEINNFNYDYAIAWIYSIISYFKPDFKILNLVKFYFIGFTLFYLFSKINIGEKTIFKYLPLFLFATFIILFIQINVSHLIKNVNMQSTVKKNFYNQTKIYKSNKNVNVIIYIGESTTSMMAGEKILEIKQRIEKKNIGQIINFTNTYSTHTHSTPSLLRALSLPKIIDEENYLQPIIDRKSIPIFNFLENKITTSYISSTDKEGYNNIHYPIFFKNFNYVSFLNESNYEFEKEFFINEFKKVKKSKYENNLLVFHSAVGHAPYYKNVPNKYLIKNDKKFNNNYLSKIIGSKYNFKKDIHIPDYISNIEYNFDLISEILKLIDNNHPTVFIYLSDHGESVFTGHGHDSSRFVHEMLRIPFFIYFNQKYLENNRNIYEKLIKDEKNIVTTDYLSKILLKIYNLDNYYNEYFNKKNRVFENLIFKRKVKDRIDLIDINFNKIDLPKKFNVINDRDTNLHVLSTNLDKEKICYHSSNTLARIKRGSIITNCLEFDLVIEKNNFFIYHPPKTNINFTLDELMANLNQIKSLWIDVKNLNETNCNIFSKKIISIKKDLNIFVEFPSEIELTNNNIISCMNDLRKNNIDVSYYLPNKLIDKCLKDLKKINKNCQKLFAKINIIEKSPVINNVSFDFKFSKILEFFDYKPVDVKFNTWHIDFEDVKKLNMSQYNLIIPFTSSFNNNIF